MSPDQWLQRYEHYLRTRTGITPHQAFECSHAVAFLELSNGYENDPEMAADEELSYWTD